MIPRLARSPQLAPAVQGMEGIRDEAGRCPAARWPDEGPNNPQSTASMSGRGSRSRSLMVAAVAPLRRDDQMIYTHRGYGHLLAKGVSLREIALDTFMNRGGTNNGLGGNMHVARPDLGIPGREGVFGTRFGIATGLAL